MVSIQYPDTGPGRGGPGVSARLVVCPECELPAEITERFWLDSTDGPILHICVTCVDGHYFRMPADRLPADGQPGLESPQAGQPGSAQPGSEYCSAPASPVGFARLPGRLGIVASVVPDGVRDEEAAISAAPSGSLSQWPEHARSRAH
jgi:hypothetical protein